ncbi:hypothetical protein ACLRDC_19160 [Gluconacetobacter sacchari]|uniref:hypothetical protein n=1 Tax=Gluconacetobacter sacchari TaxID=92759 RepID=UPI0039B5910C
MRNVFCILTAAFLAGAAHAAPIRAMPGMEMDHRTVSPATHTPDPMADMPMDRQMALCADLESRERQGKTLSSTMTRQRAACRSMTMGAPAQAAPAATMER